jgi:beta-carotene 3-hydroxylase
LHQAHCLHHAVKGRDGCVSFGFIYAEPAAKLGKKLQDGRRGVPTSAR